MKFFFLLFLALAVGITCAGCLSSTPSAGTQGTIAVSSGTVSVAYDKDDLDPGQDTPGASSIILQGNSITFNGTGITVHGTDVTIASGGTYNIRGTLDDGQIMVDTEDQETVKLVLNGVNITCSTRAPLYMVNAEKTVITLADGTDNYVADCDSYTFENADSDEPDAAIFSRDDLTINGNGSLTVTAHYRHGIVSKDDLRITGGQITVTSVNDGIRGRDSLAVKGGTLAVQAGGDGMQANNDEDPEKGYIVIEGGTITITAQEDGIRARTSLAVTGGTMTLTTGGGSSASTGGSNPWGGAGTAAGTTETSGKGLKAGSAVTISGGTITVDAADDAVHSDDRITIDGGTIVAASGDDGIHADTALAINGGSVTITKSYEGIESAAISLGDGTIRITARDDGINGAGGNDGSSVQGRPGQETFDPASGVSLIISSGYIIIDAGGDGIDVNGPITMSGGTVLVNGPADNGNGALDYLGTFTMSGGYFLAAGSAGMAEAPSAASTQNSVMLTFPSPQPAGTMVHIEAEEGEEILTFVPTKMYQSLVFSSSRLEKSATYSVYTGGQSTGLNTDGLFSGGKYNAGTRVMSFTVSGSVTYAGSSGAVGGRPGRP